jgi:hypothetical protein
MNFSPQQVAAALGGEASGYNILAPGPGHPPDDRSLSVKIDPSAPDGLLVHSFSPADDDLDCKDYVRGKLGIQWEPTRPKVDNIAHMSDRVRKPVAKAGSTPATYVYKQADGTPYLRVARPGFTVSALPIGHSKDKDAITEASLAVAYGVMDLAPADPVGGILIAQLIAAHEAALAMYRKGWSQPAEYFQARTKYLQLADKAARTAMMLTERLDHHRGRGQQHITVKHVTTNNVTADQAIIADRVTTGGALRNDGSSPALLAAGSRLPDQVGVGEA